MPQMRSRKIEGVRGFGTRDHYQKREGVLDGEGFATDRGGNVGAGIWGKSSYECEGN